LTILCSRKSSTKEVIKCCLTKYSISVDTTLLFSRLQCILVGKSILCGLWLPLPKSPKMCAGDTSAFAVCWASNNDSFNLFHTLPEATLYGGTHHPIHCRIDSSYDSAKSKLHVAIWFCWAYSGDASLRDHLHFDLPPPDDPPDKGGSSDSDSESSAGGPRDRGGTNSW
jgi:hypothetical protein